MFSVAALRLPIVKSEEVLCGPGLEMVRVRGRDPDFLSNAPQRKPRDASVTCARSLVSPPHHGDHPMVSIVLSFLVAMPAETCYRCQLLSINLPTSSNECTNTYNFSDDRLR